MTTEIMKIVITGNVDHGKSSFIGRLYYDTGSLPADKMEAVRRVCAEKGMLDVEFAFVIDHLEEEREQALTIDTAQTFFATPRRRYTIIDAPGHKEFMKNMMTGASQAEASVLVVDALEGVREQTRRHACILGMFNLGLNIAVLNKMDLVGYAEAAFRTLRAGVLALLKQHGITPAHVIPASAKMGDNFAVLSPRMPWYKGPTVLAALDGLEKGPGNSELPFRMPVQDVYNVGGRTVAAGRVEAGRVRAGGTVALYPGGAPSTVESVSEFLRTPDAAEAGESTGLVLACAAARRGMVAADPAHPPSVARSVEANLFWMAPAALLAGDTVTFRCTTQAIPCAVRAIRRRIDSATLEVLGENAPRLEEHEVGEIELALAAPAALETYAVLPELGRFVLERGPDIVAAGIITGCGE